MKNDRKLVYVTRDIERALGREPGADFIIVTNRIIFSEMIKKRYPDFVHLIDSKNETSLDTLELLKSDVTQKIIREADGDLVVFKNSPQIENLAKENGFNLINPSALLAEKVENKLSQTEWLRNLSQIHSPLWQTMSTKEITFAKDQAPIVLQWAHAHSGEGTVLITTKKDLLDQQAKFPDRIARVADYINGPTFTVNIVVGDKVLIGNISYQITGLAPFTDNVFTTVGNDWSLTHSLLNESEVEEIENIASAVGLKMKNEGWRGLFGIDVMKDEERNEITLIEINARQPASTSYESFLQEQNRQLGVVGQTTFEAHLASLQNKPLLKNLVQINDGAQVVQRITKQRNNLSDTTSGSLELAGYRVIKYENTEINSDLLRIQSPRGIMESHNKLNSRGKEIADTIDA